MDLEPGGVWGQDCKISRGQVTKGLRDLDRGDLILMAMRRESLRVSFEESEVGVAFWKEPWLQHRNQVRELPARCREVRFQTTAIIQARGNGGFSQGTGSGAASERDPESRINT